MRAVYYEKNGSAAEVLHVGDGSRIQRFDPDGNYLGSIEGPALAGERVQSLAVDSSGGVNAPV